MNINIIYVCCLSRMMRKYHVRFLEGKAPAMGLTYSTYHMQSVRHKNGEMIVVMQYDDELYTVARRRMRDFKNKWCGL